MFLGIATLGGAIIAIAMVVMGALIDRRVRHIIAYQKARGEVVMGVLHSIQKSMGEMSEAFSALANNAKLTHDLAEAMREKMVAADITAQAIIQIQKVIAESIDEVNATMEKKMPKVRYVELGDAMPSSPLAIVDPAPEVDYDEVKLFQPEKPKPKKAKKAKIAARKPHPAAKKK